MAPIGFSTGCIKLADLKVGLSAAETSVAAVELCALREHTFIPLIDSLDELNLDRFSYVSFHVPSKLEKLSEEVVVERLRPVASRGWSMVVHPDVALSPRLWKPFGELLCIENMDKRKPCGRTTDELSEIFEAFPEASLCFDIGHARQIDPTMGEAERMLKTFAGRIRQIHLSAVDSHSKHATLDRQSISEFQRLAHLIPKDAPVILETPIKKEAVPKELDRARRALGWD